MGDFDMKAIEKLTKNKDKKLRGKRKREFQVMQESTPGQDFHVDLNDTRFSALFDKDSKFGIDKQDKDFKDTSNMKKLLQEQSKRRRVQIRKESQSRENRSSQNRRNEFENTSNDKDSLLSLASKFKKLFTLNF